MRLASVTIHMDRILDMTAEERRAFELWLNSQWPLGWTSAHEWFDRDEMTFRPVRYERGDVDA